MPDASGRIRGIVVPDLPWKRGESLFTKTPEERQARYLELYERTVTDESIHSCLCVEEGCARCSR